MDKKIRYTEHSLIQIASRKLEINDIDAIVALPEQIVVDEDNINRLIYQSHFVDKKGKLKLLRVVVEETNEEIAVLTAYPTSQINRYWKKEQQ